MDRLPAAPRRAPLQSAPDRRRDHGRGDRGHALHRHGRRAVRTRQFVWRQGRYAAAIVVAGGSGAGDPGLADAGAGHFAAVAPFSAAHRRADAIAGQGQCQPRPGGAARPTHPAAEPHPAARASRAEHRTRPAPGAALCGHADQPGRLQGDQRRLWSCVGRPPAGGGGRAFEHTPARAWQPGAAGRRRIRAGGRHRRPGRCRCAGRASGAGAGGTVPGCQPRAAPEQ